MQITLKGRIPSKKNSRIINRKTGKSFPSKNYQEWHKDASKQLQGRIPDEAIECTKKVTITFYAPDKRKYDLTNKAESIMDLLVDNKILEDDNYQVVPNIHLKFGDVDKNNARAVIKIDKVKWIITQD